MLSKVAAFAACLTLTAAIPLDGKLVERQTPNYPDNGTLVDAPNTTALTRPNPDYTTDQLNQIKLAYTASERLALLKSYGDPNDYFKFDLTPNGSHSNAANGLGGQGYLAHVGNYPVLMGTGLSVAIGYLNPCGLDSMHIHNRATEMVTLVSGVSLKTGFVLEDGFGKHASLRRSSHSLTLLRPACHDRNRVVPRNHPPNGFHSLGVQRQLRASCLRGFALQRGPWCLSHSPEFLHQSPRRR